MDLAVPAPDWVAILGGSEEEARWIADRDRKFGMLADQADEFLSLAAELERRGALFRATPDILGDYPLAADWYVSLAGYALNTLSNIRQGPESHGLKVRVSTVRRKLAEGKATSFEQRRAFADWINADLGTLYPAVKRSPAIAKAVVFGILGGRSLGRNQNQGGDHGVLLLKRLFVSGMKRRQHFVELQTDDGWITYEEESALAEVDAIRFEGRLILDFTGGGGRPDIRMLDRGLLISQGEVKARKDKSNVWESWMPSIENHLRTWAADAPDAPRLFFGTLVTSDMIDGTNHRGTYRAGLKRWHENGLLQNAYNITKIMAGDGRAARSFEELLVAIERRLAT